MTWPATDPQRASPAPFGPSPIEGLLLIFKKSTRIYVDPAAPNFRDTLAVARNAAEAAYWRDFAIGFNAALGVPPPIPPECAACAITRSLGGQFCGLHQQQARAPGHAEGCECKRCGGDIG